MTEQNYRIRIKLSNVEIEVEGDKEFVEKNIEEFKKEMPKIAKELPSKEKTAIQETQKEVGLEGLSLAEFYKKKNPKTDVETVLIVAYYLCTTEKKEEFFNKDIKNATDKIGHKITNIAQILKEAAKGNKAYLVKGSRRGSWTITLEGKRFVDEELPIKSGE